MLLISIPDPSPILQMAVYMAGMLGGYALLTRADEWQRAWETVRDVFARRRPR
jgi:hypothetical protein